MSADIDIDMADREQLLPLIWHRTASQRVDGHTRRHNSGIYTTDIPYDAMHQCAAIDHNEAEHRGYFKIDLLNMSVYRLIRDQAHYDAMLARTPPWSRLWQQPDWAKNVVHVGNHGDLLQCMKPDSITRMAAFISIIRPGKSHLQKLPWDQVIASVWDGDDSRGYIFKRSHAVGYACLVALHMNLLDSSHQGD